jgi:hypothetical protein
VDFTLRTPRNTVAEGTFRDGRIVKLTVTPKTRADDVVNLMRDASGAR